MKTLKEIVTSTSDIDESLLDDFGSQAEDIKKKRIEEWLEKNNREKSAYTINDDYTIDIGKFDYKGSGNFPDFIQFRRCRVDFDISASRMTSLRGCPEIVANDFYCHENNLKNLVGGPKRIGGNYVAFNCNLTSLEGSPANITGNFDISINHIKSLKGGPKRIGGDFRASENELKDLVGGPIDVLGIYDVSSNDLKSLKGCPEVIHCGFYINYNDLKDLDYPPESIIGYVYYDKRIPRAAWNQVRGNFLLVEF